MLYSAGGMSYYDFGKSFLTNVSLFFDYAVRQRTDATMCHSSLCMQMMQDGSTVDSL